MDVVKLFEERYIPFAQVFDSIAEGVCIAGANFEFIYWNQSAREILFDEPDDSPQSNWAVRYGLYNLHTQKHLSFEELPMVKALNGETFSDYRILSRNPRNPGGYILSVNGRPIRNGAATVGGITTFRDITNLIKLEQDQVTERALYKSILDLMPGIVFMKDLEGKFLYGNKGFHDLLETESVIGRVTEDYLAREQAEMIRENDKLVLQTAEAHMFEEIIFWKNGTRSIFHTMRFPYYNSQKVITGICAVARDITREVDDRLRIENERVRSAHVSKLASLGTLAAEIAHELRNPMTILSTSSKVIEAIVERNFPEKDKLHACLGTIQQTISRMNEIINSLNGLSRDSTHEVKTKFKVEDMLRDIEVICGYRTRTAGVGLTIEYPKGDPGFICAHQIQISEVVLNLVMNAIDAVETLKDRRVWIKVWREYQEMNISVHDSGTGVLPAHRDKIFEPYFTTKVVNKGTGLGLSIAAKIVKQHNGTLEYHHSESDHYFYIKLPLG